MIAVETVIRKLIGEYEFVIIPGFGALLSHQVPASFDTSSGFFMPPAKKLAFNEYLKLDDGLLANYISREEKWPHIEAVEYVRSYTEKLRAALESSGKASIAGIGEFHKNVEGKLVFEPNTGKYFKDEWFGFEKVQVKALNRELVSANSSAGSFVNDSDVEVIELGEEKVKPRRWLGWAAAAVITGLLCGISFFLVNSSNSEIRSTLNPFTELFASKPATEVESTPVEEVVEVKEEAPAPAKIASVDSAAKALPAAAAPVDSSVAPATPVITSKSADSRFYVIAGAFKGPKQANVLLTELKGKGFENAAILPATRYSKKVKVSIGGYDNETDAYRSSAKLKQVIGEEGWVFKNKAYRK
ncbi:HU domain-containing protein [Dyadobacter luticola]|uniref:SPOR domain-containing protein n=1 Tax=Dyadobacter luticola TaxID=1979387 RepID=A0A5R9L3I4_9BACT|nr:SPOR domain-containing protein [Dyadobacter luticola]TLV02971.1 SPOR domain-containing protein [Dyadobacter luticola]